MKASVPWCGPEVAHTLSSASAPVPPALKGTGKGDNCTAAALPGLHRGAGRDSKSMGVTGRANGMGQDFPAWKRDERRVMKEVSKALGVCREMAEMSN